MQYPAINVSMQEVHATRIGCPTSTNEPGKNHSNEEDRRQHDVPTKMCDSSQAHDGSVSMVRVNEVAFYENGPVWGVANCVR